MIDIKKYNKDQRELWNQAVATSRNGTFLHHRNFMDYHSDRFEDYSLLAMDGNKIVAMLPANRSGNTVYSHQGLTYGSWLMQDKCDAVTMMQVMKACIEFLKADGIEELIYKPVPHIYHRYPAEEDLYAIFRYGAVLTECNLSTTIDLDAPIRFDRGNKSAVNKAMRAGITINEGDNWEAYWEVLNEVLNTRHSTSPVHTVEEITLLQSRFPDNIKLYTALLNGKVIAGVVIFYTGQVAHAQYIASSNMGREHKALALIFDNIITQAAQSGYRYFDFGISCENHGLYLNEGLVTQKARMGGRGITYNAYSIKL